MKILSVLVLGFSLTAMAAPVLPKKISAVYSYSCKHNFIEGEGVSNGFVSCLPGQNLGKYTAEYKYYLFKSLQNSNFPLKGTSRLFEASVCGAQMERFACDEGAPKLEFGLSEKMDGDFMIAVTLTTNPDRVGGVVGFAALPKANGECAEGLIRVRPYIAFPPTMFRPLPSTFVNLGGSLNSMVVAQEGTVKEPFSIFRTPAEQPCDRLGRCAAPVGEEVLVKEVPYVASSPVVCALPAEVVDTLVNF